MDDQKEAVLTQRERDVLSLVAAGQSAKTIARTMAISPRTVERHIEDCRLKLGARNRVQLIANAITNGHLVDEVDPQRSIVTLVDVRMLANSR